MRKQWSCLGKEIMQGTMPGARRRGRPRTAWMDNINTWTWLSIEESIRMTEDRDKWRKYVHGVANPRIEDGWRTEQNRIIMQLSRVMTVFCCRHSFVWRPSFKRSICQQRDIALAVMPLLLVHISCTPTKYANNHNPTCRRRVVHAGLECHVVTLHQSRWRCPTT